MWLSILVRKLLDDTRGSFAFPRNYLKAEVWKHGVLRIAPWPSPSNEPARAGPGGDIDRGVQRFYLESCRLAKRIKVGPS